MSSLISALPNTPSFPVSAPASRRFVVLGILTAHAVGLWALSQMSVVQQAVAQVAPLMVRTVVAPPPPPPPPPQLTPPPKAAPLPFIPPPEVQVATVNVPRITATVVEPPAPMPPTQAGEVHAPPQPVQPLVIPATAVQYLDGPPAPEYPHASIRKKETGSVMVRVQIGAQGRALQVLVARSSGFTRLDEAALAAVRATRFKPHTVNGEAVVVWATLPIDFDLNS